jgi:hypothetical protein
MGTLPIAAKSGVWCMAFAKMTSEEDNEAEEDAITMDYESVSSNESHQSDSEEERDDDEDGAADVVTYSGASAVFKVLQARPAILQPLHADLLPLLRL